MRVVPAGLLTLGEADDGALWVGSVELVGARPRVRLESMPVLPLEART
jgi:hypothetical protein